MGFASGFYHSIGRARARAHFVLTSLCLADALYPSAAMTLFPRLTILKNTFRHEVAIQRNTNDIKKRITHVGSGIYIIVYRQLNEKKNNCWSHNADISSRSDKDATFVFASRFALRNGIHINLWPLRKDEVKMPIDYLLSIKFTLTCDCTLCIIVATQRNDHWTRHISRVLCIKLPYFTCCCIEYKITK